MSEKEIKKALFYHSKDRPGKTEIIPTKPLCTPEEMALAYTPGAIFPAAGISKERWNAYKYTNKGNLVAVISNGSAIPGKGNLGALASKPILEGKSALFKLRADIDAFDIELGEENTERMIQEIQAMAPTFGAISLEDISRPRSHEIENRLQKLLGIPVVEDKSLSIAVCIGAATLNASELVLKEPKTLKIVINGTEDLSTTTIRLLNKLGIEDKNILLLNNEKKSHIEDLTGSDVYIEFTQENIISKEELISMAPRPILFMLNDNAIDSDYYSMLLVRPDSIIATMHHEQPNQICEALVFPYLFRGALDTYSTMITDSMLLAAIRSIAGIAHRPVPHSVEKAYHRRLEFGKEYILPKPNDNRLLTEVSSAVALAAIEGGIARRNIINWKEYRNTLLSRMEHGSRYGNHTRHHNSRENKLHRRYIRGIPEF